MFWFEDDFSNGELKRHFDFYEPLTVHESSLSPCIHSILAAKIGYKQKSYEMYLRTARLDLDDYNNDTEDGLHITSMGGTWMAIVVQKTERWFSILFYPKNGNRMLFESISGERT